MMLAASDFDEALQCYRAGRLHQAETLCRQSLAGDPTSIDAQNLLALLACRHGRLEEGIEHSLSILQDHPDNVQALEILGDALTSLGQHQGAAEAFRRACTYLPEDGGLATKYAVALYHGGELEAAIVAYRRAIGCGGVSPGLCLELGTLLAEAGRPEESLAALECALLLDNGLSLAWALMAEQLVALERVEDALTALRRAQECDPNNASLCFNIGRYLAELLRTDESLVELDKAIALNPRLIEAHSTRSSVLWRLGRCVEAEAAARLALFLDATHLNALLNLSNALRSQVRDDEALESLAQALELDPNCVPALVNQGHIWLAQGKSGRAQMILERALAIDPECTQARFNLALLHMRAGRQAQGWAGYGLRWDCNKINFKPAHDLTTIWTGGDVPGGELVVWGEQGIGDEVMFAGLLPALLERVGDVSVTLECQPRLVDLFQRSFPQVRVVSASGRAEPPPGAHVPLGDLPGILRPDLRGGEWLPQAYLKADPVRRDALRRRYRHGKPMIGLAWHSINRESGKRRSLDDLSLQTLLSQTGVDWVCLQYGDQADRWAPFLTIDPEIDQTRDLDAFAAQVAAMDLVVTIDNSAAHMAGALGVPTVLMLPFDSDWRWFTGGETSPWYPSLRLVQQVDVGDWKPVVRAVSDLLSA